MASASYTLRAIRWGAPVLRWLSIIFVLFEAVLVLLAYLNVFPAHYLAPFSIGALIVYVALITVFTILKRGDKS
jgi:hypothetical protein